MMKSKLFLMLSVAAFAMLLAGCKETPVDVAKKWHKATFKDADSGKAVEYVTGDEAKERTKDIIKGIKAIDSTSFGDAKIDGDTATVRVTTKFGDKKYKEDYELEKDNGKWKISKIKDVND